MEVGSEPLYSHVPKLKAGVDITRIKLSIQEGFVASRIDGQTNLEGIIQLVGKPARETKQILKLLQRAGIIDFEDPSQPLLRSHSLETFPFPADWMAEPCDLSQEDKKRILFQHAHLPVWTHYELLKVRRRDDARSIKRAYFDRSKEWHPDRFKRGNQGNFKRLIEEIYRAVKVAYDVLSDPKARAAYDATCAFAPDEEDLQRALDAEKKLQREALRDEEAVERRRRKNPMKKRLENAKELIQQALEKEKQGDLLSALTLAQTAVAFDPRNEHQACAERLKRLSADVRIAPYLRRGLQRESQCHFQEAIRIFTEALEIAPDNAKIRLRLAYNLLMAGGDVDEANMHAHKAMSGLRDDPEAHFVLGLCYERAGMDKAAARSFSRALQLKPNHSEANKHLKKLKWGFLVGG